MLVTNSLPPRGMTRSMYLSCARRAEISERVETVCTNVDGIDVLASASAMIFDKSVAVWILSLPPFRMAALPDLIASAAMFTTTSGRASKMTSSTPTGQVTRCSASPGPSSFANVTCPVGRGSDATSLIPCSIASYLPARERSRRLNREAESLPASTRGRAASMSALFAARTASRFSESAVRIALSATSRSDGATSWEASKARRAATAMASAGLALIL